MSKGEDTREQILEQAMETASRLGLEGISIGHLARKTGMSKSGLFAHFGSKEKLQMQVIQSATDRFIEEVTLPAIRSAARGEPRVRSMFEHWLKWAAIDGLSGGCIFVTAAVEFDDRPGPVRDLLAKGQQDWVDTIARAARIAVEERHFRADLDCDLFAYAAYSLMLGAHHYHRLLDSPRALDFARSSFEALIQSAK